MSKHNRSGGKFTNTHTSLIPLASIIADCADGCEHVTKISPGFIKAGLRSTSGQRRIKITKVNDNCLLLAIRGNISHQEITLYTDDVLKTISSIKKCAKDNHVQISYK